MREFKNPLFVFAAVALLMAFLFTGIGGALDITGAKSFVITKEHFWNDGLFLLGLSILALVLFVR